ncbi:hypothetical protein C5167_011837 [Papaver somniferum]|uniref:Vesicle transport protein n=1 Tax=Papaver somniferum TaxID=3469 RepID=A0A4Y7IZQ8_PAPSO|nr:hypothetical protein C5167_011837 [Papaver somniferum]
MMETTAISNGAPTTVPTSQTAEITTNVPTAPNMRQKYEFNVPSHLAKKFAMKTFPQKLRSFKYELLRGPLKGKVTMAEKIDACPMHYILDHWKTFLLHESDPAAQKEGGIDNVRRDVSWMEGHVGKDGKVHPPSFEAYGTDKFWSQEESLGASVFLSGEFLQGNLSLMVLMPQKFAICFTLGCIFIIGSFFALKGPKNQLAHMSSKKRLPFTLGFIGTIVGTGGPSPYSSGYMMGQGGMSIGISGGMYPMPPIMDRYGLVCQWVILLWWVSRPGLFQEENPPRNSAVFRNCVDSTRDSGWTYPN